MTYRNTYISLLFLVLISVGLSGQQTWFTTLDTALNEAKLTDKKVLIEFGAVINEFALFIPDETWNNDSVQLYVNQYIPVSILLAERDARARTYQIDFTPTLLIHDAQGNELFRNEGLIEAESLAALLKFFQSETTALEKLIGIYGSAPSMLGDLQMVEEYIYLHSIAPEIARDYCLKQSKTLIDALSRNRGDLDAAQKERLQMLDDFREILYISDNKSIVRLKKLNIDEVDTRNKALLCYFQYRLNSSLGAFDEAVQVARKLESLVGKAPQAANYLARIKED